MQPNRPKSPLSPKSVTREGSAFHRTPPPPRQWRSSSKSLSPVPTSFPGGLLRTGQERRQATSPIPQDHRPAAWPSSGDKVSRLSPRAGAEKSPLNLRLNGRPERVKCPCVRANRLQTAERQAHVRYLTARVPQPRVRFTELTYPDVLCSIARTVREALTNSLA
jgi:hypothetical protein